MTDLEIVAKTNNLDIMCICEHWAKKDQISYLSVNGYKLVSSYCRVSKIHGGTAIFVRENLACEVKELASMQYNLDIHFEYSAIIVNIRNYKKICILSVYRSPTGSLEIFLTNLSLLLSEICPKHDVVLCGDLNINSLNKTSTDCIALSDLLTSFELYNIINCPTRVVTNKNNFTSSSAIDYLISNKTLNFIRCDVSNIHLSDHFAIFFDYLCPYLTQSNSQSSSYKYRKITQHSLQLLKTNLSQIPWIMCDNKDIHDNFQSFLGFFLDCYNKYCPVKTCIPKDKESNPWYTRDLKKLKKELSLA